MSNGAVPLSIAPALHHLQVGLHLVQVLFKARQQPVVLEQRVLATQVELEFLVGGFEHLRAPRAPLLQLLRDNGDIPGEAGPGHLPGKNLLPSSGRGQGASPAPPA